jgi:CRISPR-associated protein Csm4
MQTILLKCPKNARFHLGTLGLDENTSLSDTTEIIHSDTLWSALICTSAKIYGKNWTDALVDALANDTKIALSSVYFCLKNAAEQCLYFLPKPLHYNLVATNDFKKTRKTAFISKRIWEEGWLPDDKNWKDNTVALQGGKFLVHLEEWKAFASYNYKWDEIGIYEVVSFPKVAVHKESKEDSFFYQTCLQLCENEAFDIHLYSLLNIPDSFVYKNELLKIITFLTYEGIGGERSTGCGNITEVAINDGFELQNMLQHSKYALLSLAIPADAIDLARFDYYKTLTRGGRKTESDGWLYRVSTIAEGALLHEIPHGKIVKLHTTADYLRFGKPFYLPIHAETLRHVPQN